MLVVIGYFSPIHFLFVLIGLGIVVDTYVGRWAAKHKAIKNGWDPRIYVSSKKTRYGLLSKMISYNLAIGTLFILDDFMLNDLALYFFPAFPITFIVTKLIGVGLLFIEFDSIDESYYKTKGKSLKSLLKIQFKKLKVLIATIVGFKKELEDNFNDK